ncbi:MAG: NAD(P)-dependent oxidoreductase [Candidatus Daviesbacteria bacterium]|nr:NAD(P)-dependent oxidoreductase [Candidatus Daviesbacteria bacterium]
MSLGLGMKVVYFSRVNKPEIEKLGAIKKELDEVLSQSDFVSLNLALNKETEGIISREKINLLKKNAIFINLAPPPLIDQEAMMEKAGSGDIAFIFDHSDDIDSALVKRFLDTKNCIVYPPVAFRTVEANTTRWETFVSNIENFIAGNHQNVVN